MYLADVFSGVEVQGDFKIVRYDPDLDRNVFMSKFDAWGYELLYIYVKDGVLYFEVGDDLVGV